MSLDLEAEVKIANLCTRILRKRVELRQGPKKEAAVTEGGYVVRGRWEGNEFVIRVGKDK